MTDQDAQGITSLGSMPNHASIVSSVFTIYEKKLLSNCVYSKSHECSCSIKLRRNGAQAGIRTRVLRATAAYTGPNYTTWALSAARILITLAN
jgi:hypothetical protein